MVKQLRTPEERLNFADAFIQVDMKPLDLDFWQEDFIKDTSPYSLTTKSRRTGFSFTVAMKGLIKAMDPARFKYVRQFVSYNEDDAKEKINYAKEFYHSIPKKYKKPLVSETKTTMEFYDTRQKTTSRLLSIACRPPRGKGGDIVFDEFAIYPKNKADIIYTAGLPVVARGGAVEIGSTPLGMVGRFYDILTDEKKYSKYTRITIPWWFSNALCTNVAEAVKLAKDLETEERVKRYGTDHIHDQFLSMLLEDFQQEYECSFIDSAMSYITMELIWANTPGMREGERNNALLGGDIDEDKEIQPEEEIEVKVFRDVDSLLAGYPSLLEKYSGGEPIRLYLGYDVARRRDAAVVFLIGKLPSGKKLSIAEIEMKNTKFEVQLDVVRKIMHYLPVIRASVDMTGMGEPLSEKLQDELGTARVEGILFNAENKEILALGVRTGLENNEFLLQNDSRFHRQIHSIKRIPTGVGRFRYDSERDQDGHADSFWAWALANYAVIEVKETKQGFYQQIKAKKEAVANIETRTAGVAKPVKAKGKSRDSLLRQWDRRG
jgi:phage FluMu gp28-like protein